MRPPIEPNKEVCCNSGCNPCIFDVYEKQLKLYERYLKFSEDEDSQSFDNLDNAISQMEYTSFDLVNNIEICDDHKLLTFKQSNGTNKKVFWKPGYHFLCKYRIAETSCTRAYTPLNLKRHNNEEYDFSVIIKIYDGGLVSSYLYNLKSGDHTLWRGPYGCYEMSPNKFNRVIMIAQGTGIAPLITVIESILNNENDMSRIVLYFSCQNINKIPLRDELYELKAFWNFSYKVFLSNILLNSKYKYQEPILEHRLNYEDIDSLRPFTAKDQLLLCGSTDFMMDYETSLKDKSEINIVKF